MDCVTMPQQARHEEDQAIYPDVCPTACWSSVSEHETSLSYGKNMRYAASAANQSAVLSANSFQRRQSCSVSISAPNQDPLFLGCALHDWWCRSGMCRQNFELAQRHSPKLRLI